MTRRLPRSSKLDINALSQLFRKTTTSYKYLFFLAVLRLLRDQRFDCSRPLSLKTLANEMLVTAWYPHTYFKLSFGARDQVAEILKRLNLEAEMGASKVRPSEKEIRHKLAHRITASIRRSRRWRKSSSI